MAVPRKKLLLNELKGNFKQLQDQTLIVFILNRNHLFKEISFNF